VPLSRSVEKAMRPIDKALIARSEAKEILSLLRRLRFVGRISASQLALLVPINMALDELNLYRTEPLSQQDLTRALAEMNVTTRR
jgi:hypothetical protein